MTPEQKLLVQSSFALIAPVADEAGAMFYDRLVELDPSLKPMFNITLREQGHKLMEVLKIAVKGLDHLEDLLPALRNLGQKHVQYGVTRQHYITGGEALIWTLRQGLGTAFTPAVEAAWVVAYTTLTDVMQEPSLQLA